MGGVEVLISLKDFVSFFFTISKELWAGSNQPDYIGVAPNMTHDLDLPEKGLQIHFIYSRLHSFRCNFLSFAATDKNTPVLPLTQNLQFIWKSSKSWLAALDSD